MEKKQLTEQRNQLLVDYQTMLDLAKAEKRSLTEEENSQLDKIKDEVRAIDVQIKEIDSKASAAKKAPANGILKPENRFIDTLELTAEERGLDLGKFIKGAVLGDWNGAEKEKRALTTTAMGTLIPKELAGYVIDKAREVSLFTQAGVPVIPMKTNNLSIARLKKDPTFSFKAEGEAAEESGFELDDVKLEAKTIYGYCYLTLEAIKSAPNLTSLVLNTFGKAIAQNIDKAMLYGADNGTAGIMNDSDIAKITYTENDGYDAFIKAVGKVKGANYVPTVAGINSQTEEMLSLLKTTEGQYLTPPKAYDELSKVVSNQLAYDQHTGSDALVFDPASMITGIQSGINIRIITDSDECVKKGLVGFVIYSMLDCKVTAPKGICKVSEIK